MSIDADLSIIRAALTSGQYSKTKTMAKEALERVEATVAAGGISYTWGGFPPFEPMRTLAEKLVSAVASGEGRITAMHALKRALEAWEIRDFTALVLLCREEGIFAGIPLPK
jgi:hypothetical protein